MSKSAISMVDAPRADRARGKRPEPESRSITPPPFLRMASNVRSSPERVERARSAGIVVSRYIGVVLRRSLIHGGCQRRGGDSAKSVADFGASEGMAAVRHLAAFTWRRASAYSPAGRFGPPARRACALVYDGGGAGVGYGDGRGPGPIAEEPPANDGQPSRFHTMASSNTWRPLPRLIWPLASVVHA